MLEKFEAYTLAKKFHAVGKQQRMPRSIVDQWNRASSSIAMNLAEGSGKPSPKEQRRYYGIALGSLRECQAMMDLESIVNPELHDLANRLGGMLFRLTRQPATKR